MGTAPQVYGGEEALKQAAGPGNWALFPTCIFMDCHFPEIDSPDPVPPAPCLSELVTYLGVGNKLREVFFLYFFLPVLPSFLPSFLSQISLCSPACLELTLAQASLELVLILLP